jgi:hypothetical protein
MTGNLFQLDGDRRSAHQFGGRIDEYPVHDLHDPN